MERVVLGRKEKTMIGLRWTGAEPKDLNDVDLAEELGATWEGDELGSCVRSASRTGAQERRCSWAPVDQ